ncbi:hypothetical protein ACIPSA_23480 [Streptomyces sp. NPDC086549]|uniref:hypothetical protein n=1 Tax=Streptomyces sp. NPDC086549 TaxID=3365752 RepID=UPI0038279F08
MADPDRPAGGHHHYDDPYERGKLDRASCGRILLGAFLIVAITLAALMLALVFGDDPQY